MQVAFAMRAPDRGRVDLRQPVVGDDLARDVEDQAAQRIALVGVRVDPPVVAIQVFVHRSRDVHDRPAIVAQARVPLAIDDVGARRLPVPRIEQRRFDAVLDGLDVDGRALAFQRRRSGDAAAGRRATGVNSPDAAPARAIAEAILPASKATFAPSRLITIAAVAPLPAPPLLPRWRVPGYHILWSGPTIPAILGIGMPGRPAAATISELLDFHQALARPPACPACAQACARTACRNSRVRGVHRDRRRSATAGRFEHDAVIQSRPPHQRPPARNPSYVTTIIVILAREVLHHLQHLAHEFGVRARSVRRTASPAAASPARARSRRAASGRPESVEDGWRAPSAQRGRPWRAARVRRPPPRRHPGRAAGAARPSRCPAPSGGERGWNDWNTMPTFVRQARSARIGEERIYDERVCPPDLDPSAVGDLEPVAAAEERVLARPLGPMTTFCDGMTLKLTPRRTAIRTTW